ncbi:MAG: hypothetical protein WCI79_02165 [Candidatus Saccharibacteria bacterium]
MTISTKDKSFNGNGKRPRARQINQQGIGQPSKYQGVKEDIWGRKASDRIKRWLYSWYISPMDQIKSWKKSNKEFNWGIKPEAFNLDIPYFIPKTETEVLMVVVDFVDENGRPDAADTFATFWDCVDVSGVAEQYVHPIIKIDRKHIELDRPMRHAVVRLIAFDIDANRGKSTQQCKGEYMGDTYLVSSELPIAFMLFPNLRNTVASGHSHSVTYILSGYRYCSGDGCKYVIQIKYIHHKDGVCRFELTITLLDEKNTHFLHPTARDIVV